MNKLIMGTFVVLFLFTLVFSFPKTSLAWGVNMSRNISVTAVSLNKTRTTITVGNSETLIAKVLPTNATNKNVTWKSSNTSVATVSSTGKITAKSAGAVNITVVTSNGKTATCAVIISAVPIPPIPIPVPTPVPVPTSTRFDGFEGSIASFWNKEFANTNYSATISKNYAKTGLSSLRVELNKTDPDVNGSKRAEISLDAETPNEEHVYSFSMLLPNGGTEDYALDKNSPESLVQWHNVPDSGEAWTSPPLALGTQNGHWWLWRLWDVNALSTNDEMYNSNQYENVDLGSYIADKGQWVDWKFHIKWGWLTGQNTILEVYKNGVLIWSKNGAPNTMNDKSGVYMKIGIYKWDWKDAVAASSISKRVVYYDNVSVS